MENKDRGSLRGMSGVSRLPLSRAALSANAPDPRQADTQKASQIPRPSISTSSRLSGVRSLWEGANQLSGSRHATSKVPARNASPARNTARADYETSLETTPPNNSTIHYVEGDENSAVDGRSIQNQKRKPRPSLSERTVETLSQIPPSPSPSPSRRPSSVASSNSSMRPPMRPGSSLRSSKSNAALQGRAASPSKSRYPASDRLGPFPREVPDVPAVPDFGQIYTPPRAFVKGSRIAVPKGLDNKRHVSASISNDAQNQETAFKPRSYAYKAKSMYNLKDSSTKTPTPRPPLASVFKDIPPPIPKSTKPLTVSSSERKKDESTVRSQATKPSASTLASAKCTRDHRYDDPVSKEDFTHPSPKSSVALRETIAKAKAARREAAKKEAAPALTIKDDLVHFSRDGSNVEEAMIGTNRSTLQRRIRTAVTSGVLNIAAMGLKSLPSEIQKMYDFDQDSKINWSEAVDLTKFIASDNDVSEIADELFPDWSAEELQEDDDKSNQFGGLQVLDLRGNCLKRLPVGVRRLTQLHTLVLSNNNLGVDALDIICQIPNLRELYLANNDLQGPMPPSLGNLANLQVLDMHSNRLSTFPSTIANLRKLEKLDVSHNQIQDLPLISLCELPLTELNLSKNALSATVFSHSFASQYLQRLDISSNDIQSMSDSTFDFPNLSVLACDSNKLKNLPDLSLLRSLTTLTASDNKIEAIPDGFTELKVLRNVNLGSNSIKVLDPHIATMDQLKALNLAGNPLRDRKYLSMNTDDLRADLAKRFAINEDTVNDVQGSGQGGSIGLQSPTSNNSRPMVQPENGTLNLSSRALNCIDVSAIEINRPVHTIRLSNNELTEFPIDLLAHPMVNASLKSLDISHNQTLHSTTYLSENIVLPALQSLNIVSTGLTSLEALTTYLSAPALRELNISCHRMTGVVPHVRTWFPSVTTLLATDNWFTSIEEEGLRGLEVVDVSNNDIGYLPPKIGELGNLSETRPVPGRLRTLECSGNTFRVPRRAVLEKGTEAILRDLRRMVPVEQVGSEWRD